MLPARALRCFTILLLVVLLIMPSTLAFAETSGLVTKQNNAFDLNAQQGGGDDDGDALFDDLDLEEDADASDGSDVEDEIILDEEIALSDAVMSLAAPGIATVASGRYLLRPLVSSGKVLEIAGGSTANGAFAQLFSSKMTQNQWFDVVYNSTTGLYTIQNVKSGRYLEVVGRNAKSGARIAQYAKASSKAQQWHIISDPSYPNAMRIVSALSPLTSQSAENPGDPPQFSTAYVLGIKGGANTDKTPVTLGKANGSTAQAFAFIPWDASVSPSTASIPDGMYTITTNLSGSPMLEIRKADEALGAKLQIGTPKNTLEQVFMIKKESDGFHSIRPLHSAATLAVPKGNKVAGIEIRQEAYQNTIGQRWSIRQNGDGTVSFFSKASGLALSVKNGSPTPGTVVRQMNYSGSNAQRFSIKTPSANTISVGYMTITPRPQAGVRVEIAGGSRKSGANVQASKADSSFTQKFEVMRVATGIVAFRSVQSGQYLTASGSNVIQEPGTNGDPLPSQQWQVERAFKGFRIINASSGQAMSLTTGGTAGYDIRLATPSTASSQLFRFKSTVLIPKHQINVLNNPTGLRLKSAAAKTAHGTPISMVTKSSTSDAQKWRLQKVSGEYFTIKCVRSGRVVGVVGDATTDGKAVQLLNNKKSAGQLWRFVPTGDGWFYLQTSNGMYMSADSVSGSRVSATTSIHQYTQKFRFAPTTYTPPSPYFGTYIDVNLSTQKCLYIVNGYPQLTTDVVTGKPSTPTPAGTFYILYKSSPAVLRGADYAAPVTFWMPFTSVGHGFHDANWQPWFGGNRWTYAGSHGCVNMPYWAAAELYRLAPSGSRVSIHW